MIDIHFHCLPGVDDGPRDWDDAVALCRAAADDGTTHIVATPHVLRHPWLNQDQSVRHDLVRQLNERLQGEPEILPGCEYYFSMDALELWQLGARGPLVGINGSQYILLEFQATALPRDAESVIYELVLAGAKPVIAHPERNLVFSRDPKRLQRMIELGALSQITAGSILGTFGPLAQAAADAFLERGLVHVVASDSHSLRARPPLLSQARERVAAEWGRDLEKQLFELKPLEITNSLGARTHADEPLTIANNGD